jgi:hypothetical protein
MWVRKRDVLGRKDLCYRAATNNTLLVEHTIAQYQLLEQLSEEDRRALTPLFYEHVNPYGLFELDLDRPPLLEAA